MSESVASPPTKPHDLLEAAGLPEGAGIVAAEYDPRLANEDLAPLKKQNWSWYNIFAFWMSDVHSVGGYVTAGSFFALGLAAWQVLLALVVGIVIVFFLANLIAKPSQKAGVPYPVISRSVFGVLGANVPAIIRGLIAVAWYGIQTYLASAALIIVALKLWPSLAPLADVHQHGFAGLSTLGWITYGILWVAQAAVFWTGMNTIRRFIDFAGPAVYVVMLALAIYLLSRAGGFGHINWNLNPSLHLSAGKQWAVFISAIALTVSYFSGPLLNFGDFSRYGKTFTSVRWGNFWGLPVNFLFFSILTVITTAATVPVFGKMITDPVETVGSIDSTFAIILAALTFTVATIGINIVANFVSPAFDFSNVSPKRISWRMGGMIAAVGSVLITPWNLYNSPSTINYTLNTLGAVIGPLFGVLLADFYLVHKQKVFTDDLFTLNPWGKYFYKKGFNPNAIIATAIGAAIGLPIVLVPALGSAVGDYSWFIGCAVGLVAYWVAEKLNPIVAPTLAEAPQSAEIPVVAGLVAE
ncbi:NCS1 family nucleobase:cation symporter-1 [Gryllotalpicola protaetiae]|uniref:NCS1 family nucleobase:cation symporter-1 n=1 Tax=Gryllotalpicola protaetiae TaxID=2419771 RepID=A0A387BP92_9MICO|nr:NCS1 family nucleobase:cation symporter-1 [Gryllotalpicola protaetiae]AYG02820.1 NCS1 family nucleobase:cation symporter-1 [Gryllotalpicola protaetiae]